MKPIPKPRRSEGRYTDVAGSAAACRSSAVSPLPQRKKYPKSETPDIILPSFLASPSPFPGPQSFHLGS